MNTKQTKPHDKRVGYLDERKRERTDTCRLSLPDLRCSNLSSLFLPFMRHLQQPAPHNFILSSTDEQNAEDSDAFTSLQRTANYFMLGETTSAMIDAQRLLEQLAKLEGQCQPENVEALKRVFFELDLSNFNENVGVIFDNRIEEIVMQYHGILLNRCPDILEQVFR